MFSHELHQHRNADNRAKYDKRNSLKRCTATPQLRSGRARLGPERQLCRRYDVESEGVDVQCMRQHRECMTELKRLCQIHVASFGSQKYDSLRRSAASGQLTNATTGGDTHGTSPKTAQRNTGPVTHRCCRSSHSRGFR